MFDPFFDPSGMTDKELQQKIFDMSNRITQARNAGMPSDMIVRMYLVIDACDEEMLFRASRKEYEQLEDEDTCVFDTESYLNKEEDKNKKHESQRKQIYKSGW
ncbi:hypothetical protein VYG11_002512 [Salmonella enterica]|nr:hypothetical protein [Salmonella enterica]